MGDMCEKRLKAVCGPSVEFTLSHMRENDFFFLKVRLNLEKICDA